MLLREACLWNYMRSGWENLPKYRLNLRGPSNNAYGAAGSTKDVGGKSLTACERRIGFVCGPLSMPSVPKRHSNFGVHRRKSACVWHPKSWVAKECAPPLGGVGS